MSKDFTIESILIDERYTRAPLTENVLKNASPDIPRRYISDPEREIEAFLARHYMNDPVAAGKRTLLLTENKGSFFKGCPGTPRYLCCMYKILNFATGCPMDCSYCILQGYFSNPLLTVYANTGDMLRELEDVFNRTKGNVLRLGTGEFTDSLALDDLTEFNTFIIPFIRQWEHVFFEVKSKTATIEQLEQFKGDPHIICSWSLNPPRVIEAEEHDAPSLDERLAAARQCREWGFGLGFHFDPLLYYDGWEDEYRDVVRRLFATIDWRRIYWISLGSFRYPASLEDVIQRRFPDTRIIYEEFITGGDGKTRYFLPIRLRMYKKLYQWIREYAPDVVVYFCMESPRAWREVFGWTPKNNAEVAAMLNNSCLRHVK